ncbi:MAG: orotate phosphoribosyltransferase [Bacteroidales bacterium]|nr:orotate phosphoribosyltransferase [Bacteroidales bacterium]
MQELSTRFAQMLLNVKCIKVQPEAPFTWASGWLSPFYCDNRKTLAYPEVRTFVKEQLARIVSEKYPQATAIAGVATGAIAQGALVADALGLPMCYVRSKAKDHGMGNLIEGTLPEGAKVVVVEDLISTGGSSLKAVEALRAAGFEILGMVASYTYGFPVAAEAFKAADVELTTLTNYEAVVQAALASGYIEEKHIPMLAEWRANPSEWGK